MQNPLITCEEVVSDPEEPEAIRAYPNGDPEYQHYITHDELMKKLDLDETIIK